MSIANRFSALIALFFACVPPFASAQFIPGAVSAGAGGAGRAAIDAGEDHFLNPASIAHTKSVFLGVNYSTLSGDNFTDRYTSVVVTDGEFVSFLPTSLAYVQRTQNFAGLGDVSQKYTSLAIGGFLRERFSFGMSVHHLDSQVGDLSYGQNNLDAGVLVTPFDNFGVGFVAYNFVPASADVPIEFRDQDQQFLAFNYIYENFARLRFDISVATSRPVGMVGLESFYNPFSCIRLGYADSADETKRRASVGLGFAGPRFFFDYAYQAALAEPKFSSHSVDLVVPF
jgi:hypothetical protein